VKRIATYSGNTYYEKMGYLIPLNFEKKVVNAVQKAADSGAEYIELLFTSENALSKFEKSNLKFISKIQKQLNNVKIETYIFERDVLTLFFAKK